MPNSSRPFATVLIFVLFLALLQTSNAQQTPPWSGDPFAGDPTAILDAAATVAPDKYPHATVLLDEVRFSIDEARRITSTKRMIYRIDSPKAVQSWGRTSVYWEPWHQERPEIKARVITPDGKVFWLDDKTLTDSPERQQSPEVYTDTRYLGGPFPGVTVGAIVEEVSIRKDNEPFFEAGSVQRYAFGSGYPIAATRVTIEYPSTLQLQFKLQNLPNIVQHREESGGRTRLIFEHGRIERLRTVSELTPPDAIQQGLLQFTTASSWKTVNETYSRQVAGQIRNADVAALVKETLLPKDSRDVKIAKLLTRLHKEVRYTGIEFGEASIVPRPTSETLARHFGDCKDKASLLVAMLRESGIPAHLALIRATGLDIDPEMPGFALFNHAIVFVPGKSPLWIDATAEFNTLGNVPGNLRGRLALVIDGISQQPIRIPEAVSADNTLVEKREFFLSPYGPAKIVEVGQATGFIDSSYRSFFSGPASKDIKDNLDSYGRSVYLAESMNDSKYGDGHNLLESFKITVEYSKARRGSTDLDQAVAAVRVDGLFSRLPKTLNTAPETKKKDDADQAPPRTLDYYFQPYQIEWQYRIHPPAGFRVHALPASVDRSLGPGRFTQSWKAAPDGTVEGTVRYDTVKGRYTVEEADAARDAIVQVLKESAILVRFENLGSALIAQGKIREGLAEYEQLIEAEPAQPSHRIRLSRALLQAGLGEQARKQAEESVKLNGNSAVAYANLGWILEHDTLGRRFGKGFDRDGAIAAYKKAIEADPKDTDPRVSLGIISEFDKNGERYAEGARLDDAIATYESLKELDKDTWDRFEFNQVLCLLYSDKFDKLLAQIGNRVGEDRFRNVVIAATAASSGTDAALLQSSRLTSTQQQRSDTLREAAQVLLRLRRYKEAADLLAVGAQGAENAANLQAQAEMFRRTKRFEASTSPAPDPESAVKNLLAALVLRDNPASVSKQFSQAWNASATEKIRDARLRYMRSLVANALGDTGLPKATVLDLIISNTEFSTEGDNATGYRVWVRLPDSEPEPVFVVREGTEFRVLAFLYVDPVGWEALARLKQDRVADAAKLLDWARLLVERGDAEDEIGGDLFARTWEKGPHPDASRLSVEAAALALVLELTEEDLVSDAERVAKGMPNSKRVEADRLLWQAYYARKRWSDLAPIGAKLSGTYPRSQSAFLMHGLGLLASERYADLEKLSRERLKFNPDDEAASSMLMQALVSQGRIAEERELIRDRIKMGRAKAGELNNYAWHALFTSVDDDALETARRSSAATNNNDYAILHTLASLYAEVGKPAEAREIMLKAMNAAHLDELDSSLWYVYGRIAEQFGQEDAARAAYAHVEQEETPGADLTSSYALAKLRLKAMDAAMKKPAPKAPAKPA